MRLPLLIALCLGTAAHAQDYEREARWRAEVVGNLVVGYAVDLRLPSGRAFLGLYAAGKAELPALLIVHGSGVHPDHGVIGSLRVALSDMGFTTLSVQMPVLAADASAQDYYPRVFPEAAARIGAAAEWLRQKHKGKLALVSHSLGAWMSQYYLEHAKNPPFAGWISLGRGGAVPRLPLPVLDVYGEKDFPAVLQSAAERRASVQVRIAGADHFYDGREAELAGLIRDFVSGL